MNPKIETELVYMPDRDKGFYAFDGKSCPTKKVLEIIGEDGINHIDKVMKSMLECRKKMFGVSHKDFYGFTNHQTFIHLPSKSVFILHHGEYAIHPNDLTEFVNPEITKEDNFYIIELLRIVNYSKRSIKILLSGGA